MRSSATYGPMPKPPKVGARRWVGRLSLPLALGLPLMAAGAGLSAPLGSKEPVAVVFPPTYSRDATLAAVAETGAALVAPGGLPSVFIVQSDAADFHTRLKRAGAWLILSSSAAALCQ